MRFTQLALLLAALVLAGCQGAPVAPVAVPPAPVAGSARGIDMATDSGDVMGQLRGAPINFVARYYRDPASRWPALTPTEAERLSALGLKIVTVWEWHSHDPAYFTYPQGYNDALSASRQAKAVGQPPGSAIYFAVDFNARGSQMWGIDQYFRGVNAGLAVAGNGRPEYRVGVYGSGSVCAEMKGAGLAQYAWLTGSTAWDGTTGYSAWNIKQAAHGGRFPSLAFDHDANDAKADYGGFQTGAYANATPAAAAVAVAAAVPVAAATVVTSAVTAVVPPPSTPAPPPPPAPAAPPIQSVELAAAAPVAPAPTAPQPVAAPPVASVAPAAPTPVAPPPSARPAPPVAVAAAALPPSPPPPPASSASRVEAAALEAASLAAATVLPRAANAAEVPHPSRREEASRERGEEPAPREHVAARAGKTAVGPKRASYTVATNNRAAAVPLRRATVASRAEVREPVHKVSTPRRADDHVAHAQGAAHATAHTAHRGTDQHGAERPHKVKAAAG